MRSLLEPAQVRDASLEEWRALAGAAPGATFFHSPHWLRVAAAFVPRARPRLLVARDAGGATAFPFLEYDLSYGLRFVDSGFSGGYGGPIRVGDRPPRTDAFYRNLWGARIVHATVTLLPQESAPAPAPFSVEKDVTHAVDLRDGLPEWDAPWAASHRRAVRKAERAGVEVAREDGRAALDEYYQAYLDTRARWGDEAGAECPKEFLRVLLADDGARAHTEFWLARREGRVASGAIVFVWRDHAVYWHGCARAEDLKHSPNNLLHESVLRDLVARGVRTYDMNPSGGRAGVIRFKESIGAKAHPIRRLRWRNPLLAPLEAAKRRLGGRA